MLASALLFLTTVATPGYRVTDLHLEANGASAVFLSDRGTVAGNLRAKAGNWAPAVWSKGRLTSLKGVERIAGINARDQLAVDTAEGPGIWQAGKGVRSWPGPRSDGNHFATVPRALGIDDAGNLAVVHTPAGSAGGNYRMVTWPKTSRIEEMYEPVAFSPDGSVLARGGGDGRQGPARQDAFLYDEHSFRVIGEKDMRVSPLAAARGGWVCGILATPVGSSERPFIWHQGRFIRPLWGSEGKAVAVNEHGEAVGEAEGVPVHWVGGGAFDLKTLTEANIHYRITEALAINAKGQILVQAEPTDRPFPRTLLLLTPKGNPKPLSPPRRTP
jgi:hypothetical protein